jgi:hypothetical protein
MDVELYLFRALMYAAARVYTHLYTGEGYASLVPILYQLMRTASLYFSSQAAKRITTSCYWKLQVGAHALLSRVLIKVRASASIWTSALRPANNLYLRLSFDKIYHKNTFLGG